jgi:hypothetical protein
MGRDRSRFKNDTYCLLGHGRLPFLVKNEAGTAGNFSGSYFLSTLRREKKSAKVTSTSGLIGHTILCRTIQPISEYESQAVGSLTMRTSTQCQAGPGLLVPDLGMAAPAVREGGFRSAGARTTVVFGSLRSLHFGFYHSTTSATRAWSF